MKTWNSLTEAQQRIVINRLAAGLHNTLRSAEGAARQGKRKSALAALRRFEAHFAAVETLEWAFDGAEERYLAVCATLGIEVPS